MPLRSKLQSAALLAPAGALLLLTACGQDTPSSPTPPACAISVAPQPLIRCMLGSEGTLQVSATEGCAWFSGSTAPWITVTDGLSGRGPGTVRFAIADNWDAPRTASIIVRGAPGPSAEARIEQAGCLYFLSPDAFTISAAGGGGAFDVVQQSQPTICGGPLQSACRWSAFADSGWITVTTPMPRQGDDYVSFTVAPNASALARTGTISVYGRTVRISQAGG